MASTDKQFHPGKCMGAMARLPWWAWLALAAFSYLALHAMALRPRTIVVDPGDVRAALAAFLLAGVVESLQYVLPVLCLSAVLARLAQTPWVTTGPDRSDIVHPDAGNGMTAWEFERLTCGGLRVMRRRGKRLAAVA